jgi:hypothetical protein
MKYLRLYVMSFILTNLVPFAARAHQEHQPKGATEPVVRTFETKDQGKIHVVIRSNGHVLAKPYVVEIRPQCKSTKSDWRSLRVVDMESACKVDIESLSLSVERREISIQIYDTDAEDYRLKSFRNPGKVKPVCLKQPKNFTVSLDNLCE